MIVKKNGWNVKHHGIKDFLFWEEVFTLDKVFGMALCDEIMKKGLNISWATTTRADLVDEKILIKMKEAEVDCIVTPCPLCHIAFDMYQLKAEKLAKTRFEILALHLSQLIGIALGEDEEMLGLSRHVVSVRSFMDKIRR